VNVVKFCAMLGIFTKCDLFSWKAMNCSRNMFKVMVPIFNEAIYIYIYKKKRLQSIGTKRTTEHERGV
jgi:hypothetical protein